MYRYYNQHWLISWNDTSELQQHSISEQLEVGKGSSNLQGRYQVSILSNPYQILDLTYYAQFEHDIVHALLE
jgi:hypothetical protein